MRYPTLFLSSAAWLFLSTGLEAQAVTLDEGVFRISVDGRAVGTEAFSIHRTAPGGDGQVLASAQLDVEEAGGALHLRVGLDAAPEDLTIRRYEVKASGTIEEESVLLLSGQRLVATTRSTRGEREREFRATARTVVLDTGLAHHYYFLVSRAPTGGIVPVVAPRAGRQYDATVAEVGSETLLIGGTQVQARRLRVEGGGESRDVWVDREGRVLRVQDASGYVAVREQAP